MTDSDHPIQTAQNASSALARQSTANVIAVIACVIAAITLIVQMTGGPKDPPRIFARVSTEIDCLTLPRIFYSTAQLPISIVWNERTGLEPARTRTLSRLTCTSIVIGNGGGSSIDFSSSELQPMRFWLEGDGDILYVDTPASSRTSKSIPVTIQMDADYRSFTFSTDVLNAQDAIAFSVYHTGAEGAMRVTGRFLGQGDVALEYPKDRPTTFLSTPLYRSTSRQMWIITLILYGILALGRRCALGEKWLVAIARGVGPASLGPWLASALCITLVILVEAPRDKIISSIVVIQALLGVAFTALILRISSRTDSTRILAWMLRLQVVPEPNGTNSIQTSN